MEREAYKHLKMCLLILRKFNPVGLVGDNGAGKSTFIKILSGVHQVDSGTFILMAPC